MKSAELCAGYGGLALAIEAVFGTESAWFSEFEEAPSKILAHHWPTVPNLGDMTKIDWRSVEPVQVLGAGTPCQDLSTAGRRRGMTEGTRSNLAVEFLRAVEIIRPEYVVWENVRGAYSTKADSDLEFCPGCMGDAGDGRVVLRALGRLLGNLSDLGYDTQWRGLRAADVGGCHGRFRVFVLGRLRDVGVPRYANVADVERCRPAGRSNADPQQGSGADRSAGDGHRTSPTAYRDRFGHERPRDSRGRWTRLEDNRLTIPNTKGERRREGWAEPKGFEGRLDAPLGGGSNASDASGDKGWEFHGDNSTLANPIRSGRLGRPREARGRTAAERASEGIAWGEYEPAIRRWERTIGRRAPRPTEPTGRNNGHRLSPRFTEWMMGLPDGWVTDPAIGISRNEQLKACGNGVVPQQAIAALADMLQAFNRAAAA